MAKKRKNKKSKSEESKPQELSPGNEGGKTAWCHGNSLPSEIFL